MSTNYSSFDRFAAQRTSRDLSIHIRAFTFAVSSHTSHVVPTFVSHSIYWFRWFCFRFVKMWTMFCRLRPLPQFFCSVTIQQDIDLRLAFFRWKQTNVSSAVHCRSLLPLIFRYRKKLFDWQIVFSILCHSMVKFPSLTSMTFVACICSYQLSNDILIWFILFYERDEKHVIRNQTNALPFSRFQICIRSFVANDSTDEIDCLENKTNRLCHRFALWLKCRGIFLFYFDSLRHEKSSKLIISTHKKL